ncbi:T9SS type A sorting domain-containing protein [Bacteroidia bacterium]|nr:T9SS type A sorting domain-containing protein [Bacteroidia bacterium]MDC3406331.1 T9SS type A sorting domain-containing protein [Bacteroidia bacterium]
MSDFISFYFWHTIFYKFDVNLKRFLYIITFFALSLNLMAGDLPKLGLNYPNPAKTTTYVDVEFSSLEAQLVLSNILGEVISVQKIPHSGTYSIDVTNIPEGVYFYTLEAGNDKITKKLTVKK